MRQVELWSGVVAIFTTTLVRAVVQLLAWWALLFTFFVVLSMVSVSYEEFPEVWVGLLNFYNAAVGPWLGFLVLLPLQIVDTLLRGLLPLWNAFFWWSKALLVQGLLPMVLTQITVVLQMATTVLDFGRAVAISLDSFVGGFDCVGDACLVQESRVLDMLSPLAAVRQFVALGGGLADAFCGILAAPLDMLLFPLLDMNFAQGVHALSNAAVQFFLVVPHVAFERCKLAQDDTFKTLMCTPDFEPAFNYLVAGVSSLGVAADNWLNVVMVIVQQALTGSAPTCDTTLAMSPHHFMGPALFGGNATAVVGLTEWMYAVTDGRTAIYATHDDASARVQLWPYAMDASLGVAAVTYNDVGDLDASSMSKGRTVGSLQTTAMLACNCSDLVVGGIEILCSILPMSGMAPGASRGNYLLGVLFPDDLAGPLLGACSAVDIIVRSVRWPATRFETVSVPVGTLNTGDCMSRGTCREVDATVFVVGFIFLFFCVCEVEQGVPEKLRVEAYRARPHPAQEECILPAHGPPDSPPAFNRCPGAGRTTRGGACPRASPSAWRRGWRGAGTTTCSWRGRRGGGRASRWRRWTARCSRRGWGTPGRRWGPRGRGAWWRGGWAG